VNWSLKSESLFQALTAWKNSFLMVAFHVSVYFPKMPKKKNMKHRDLSILLVPSTRFLEWDKTAIVHISSYLRLCTNFPNIFKNLSLLQPAAIE